ncbi:hypothetical protein [Clostridium autoethanogenum]|nr:hypothetical protein [Clostridium autoethanogenum]
MNQEYINWIVNFIRNGTINIKTGKPFVIDDIINADYKVAVQIALNNTTA